MKNAIFLIGWPEADQVVMQPRVKPVWVGCWNAGEIRFFLLLLLENQFWGSGGYEKIRFLV